MMLTSAATSDPPDVVSMAELSAEVGALHQKLDRLAEQIGYLHDRTRALEELKNELTPIAKDALSAAREELQGIEQEFNSEEVVYLLRKLLRSTPRFVWLLDRMESVAGLAEELAPLGREMMKGGIEWLDGAERKGYFRLAKGALSAADRVAQHYGQEEIDSLGARVIPFMDTVKDLSHPEILALASRAASSLHRIGEEPPPKMTPWGLLSALRDPEIQQGLGVAVAMLRGIAPRKSRPETNPTVKE